MSSENVSAEQLRLYIERIERIEEDAKGLSDDKRDVFAEAKGTGFDPATMRKILKLRKMEPAYREEADALLDTYRAALDMTDGEQISPLRDPAADRIRAAIVAALRASGRVTIVGLKKAIKDKAATALGYDELTVHLGILIEREDVASGPGRLADFPDYWAI